MTRDCDCLRRNQFRTRAEAQKYIALNRFERRMRPEDAPCKLCGRWHITTAARGSK